VTARTQPAQAVDLGQAIGEDAGAASAISIPALAPPDNPAYIEYWFGRVIDDWRADTDPSHDRHHARRFANCAVRLELPFYDLDGNDLGRQGWAQWYWRTYATKSNVAATAETVTAPTRPKENAMDTSEFFQSRWLRGDDLKGKAYKVAVQAVAVEDLKNKDGQTERKLAVTFRGIPKPLILNKTNYLALVAAAGGSRDSADWIGQTVIVRPEEVTAFGETTIGVRIKQLQAPVEVVEPEVPAEPEWFAEGADEGLAGMEAVE
jgi:hypothetical protein